MNIKNFSKITGLSSHTLRYYEKIDLISDVKRDVSGHRDYSSDDIAWVEFLKKLKVTGTLRLREKTTYLIFPWFNHIIPFPMKLFLNKLYFLKVHIRNFYSFFVNSIIQFRFYHQTFCCSSVSN